MVNVDSLLGGGKYAPFYFMRHGQTPQNAQGIIRSHGKVGLDATGREQAKHAAQLLRGKGIDCVYASDLPRNEQTGRIIADALRCELEIVPELRTWKLPFAGQKVSEIKDQLNYYQQHPDKAPPGGESGNTFRKRAVSFFKDQISDAKEEPEEGILIVGNGRHTWDLRNILEAVRSGAPISGPMKVKDGPYPGSLLKIELPSMKIVPVYLAPKGENQSL